MTKRPAPYTKADVTRAANGAKAAGLQVREILCSAEGVRVFVGGDNNDKTEPSNHFDKSNHARSA